MNNILNRLMMSHRQVNECFPVKSVHTSNDQSPYYLNELDLQHLSFIIYFLVILAFARYYFSVHPKKNTPPLVNSWIPGISILFYLPYTERFLGYCRKLYGDIYTVQIRNDRLHIILDPSCGARIFREHRTFSFTHIIDQAESRLLGIPAMQAEDPILRKESLLGLKEYILSQKSVDILMEKFDNTLRGALSRELNKLNTKGILNTEGVVLNMSRFITKLLFESTGKTLFGDTWPVDDGFIDDVIVFDQYAPMLLKNFPYIFKRKGISARERILQRMVKLLEQPLVNPSEYVAHRKEVRIFLENDSKEKLHFRNGYTLEETARGMLFLTFVIYVPPFQVMLIIQSSTVPASIWLLSQLARLSDKTEISSKVQQYVLVERSDKESTRFNLDKLIHLPIMKSAFSEMLRVFEDGASLREVSHDTTITVNNQEYFLECGSVVVFLFSCVHKDPDIYEKPSEFHVDRFVPQYEKGSEHLKRVERNNARILRPFVPFGGGVNQVS